MFRPNSLPENEVQRERRGARNRPIWTGTKFVLCVVESSEEINRRLEAQ